MREVLPLFGSKADLPSHDNAMGALGEVCVGGGCRNWDAHMRASQFLTHRLHTPAPASLLGVDAPLYVLNATTNAIKIATKVTIAPT